MNEEIDNQRSEPSAKERQPPREREGLAFRIIGGSGAAGQSGDGGDMEWVDPALDATLDRLNRMGRADRAEPDRGFESRIAGATAGELTRAVEPSAGLRDGLMGREEPVLAGIGANRTRVWLRLAAAVVASGAMVALWSALRDQSPESLLPGGTERVIADGSSGSKAAPRPDEITSSAPDQSMLAQAADLVVANLDDDTSSEIDALFEESDRIRSGMRNDWLDGGAM